MRFVSSQLLFLIWLLPLLGLLVAHGLRRRRRILTAYATDHALAAIAPESDRNRYAIKAALVVGAMLLGIFALSGPQYGFRWQEMHRRGVDLIIAIDCSRSMTATDIPPSRLERAKREIVDLLNMMTGDRVGLVAFAGTAFVQCPLTLDYQSFHLFLSTLSPDVLPVGGTDLSEAVKVALSAFGSETDSDKAVILITDGESTGADPMEAAEKAHKAGVRLFCIGVGKPEGAPIPQSGGFQKDPAGRIFMSRLDETILKKMATLTDGGYVRSVAGDMDLEVIYRDQIQGKMKAAELEGGRRKVWDNRYQWALLPALVLLIWEMLIPAYGRRRTSVILLLPAACLLLAGPRAEAGWINPPLHAGIAAYENGDYQAALKSFIDAQLKDPDRPEIDFNIGNAYYRLKDYASAARSFEQAARVGNPQLKQKALYNMGDALFRSGNLKEAVDRFQQALDLDPQDQAARKNLEFAQKALQKQKEPPSQQTSGEKESGSDKKDQSHKTSQGKDDESKDQRGETQDDPAKKPPEQSKRGSQPPEKEVQGKGGGKATQPPEPKGADPSSSADAGERTAGSLKEPSRTRSEQILNRLQDRPGRALMPAYGNRTVDKDW
ncbi:MAG: VWA domain-containing protein [Desulfobacterales bacterium]|nr:VWA domain-containing protein [Desulfobacterales bacterium]